MNKYEVIIRKDDSEDIDYNNRQIPMYLRTRKLSDYVNMRSFPHWHEDIEIMYLVSGSHELHIKGETLVLRTNDCVVINSRAMHYTTSHKGDDSTFTCFLFDPSLFTGNPYIYQKYIRRVLQDPEFDYLFFSAKHVFHSRITELINCATELLLSNSFGFELKIVGMLHDFWSDLLVEGGLLSELDIGEVDADLSLYRDSLSYIHQHYMDKVNLDDIAAAGNVCRSKCCKLFQRYSGSSPVELLNHYRLEISCKLLADQSLSVTDVAGLCGFSTSSYFTQQFKKRYGMTPMEYRTRKMF